MEKIYKFIILILVFSINMSVFAQKYYVTISSGYSFGMSKQGISNIEGSSYIYDFEGSLNNNITKSSAIIKSFGTGFDISGTLGYKISKVFSTEMMITYHLSSDINSNFLDNIGTSYKESFHSKMIQFKPSFIISAGYQKINPYLKFGPTIGIGSVTLDSDMFVPFGDGSKKYYETSFKMDGSVAFGIHSAAGLSYQLNNQICFFGELHTINLSYSPSKGKYSEYKIDHVDYVSVLEKAFLEYEYVSHLNNQDNTDLSKPTKVLKTSYPFGSIGFNIGLNYNF